MRWRCAVALVLACGFGVAQREGRYRPPAAVECPRESLTSFTGRVTAYARTQMRIRLTLATDWATTERLVLRAPFKLLIHAEPFREEDWPKVETKKGQLRPGMRATVWRCGDGRQVLDWQPPAEPR